MIEIFLALDKKRFDDWWDKKYPSLPLRHPMASGTIKIVGERFEFDAKGAPAAILPVGLKDENYMGPADSIWSLEHIADYIAWLPGSPEKWYFYHGTTSLVLGWREFAQAGLYGQAVAVPDTPMQWLEKGGSFPLDGQAMDDMRGLAEITCSQGMAEKLKARLLRMPRLTTG